jgi:hypothetical protein
MRLGLKNWCNRPETVLYYFAIVLEVVILQFCVSPSHASVLDAISKFADVELVLPLSPLSSVGPFALRPRELPQTTLVGTTLTSSDRLKKANPPWRVEELRQACFPNRPFEAEAEYHLSETAPASSQRASLCHRSAGSQVLSWKQPVPDAGLEQLLVGLNYSAAARRMMSGRDLAAKLAVEAI